VGFEVVSGADVLRVWDYLSARAKSVDDDPVVWAHDHEDVADASPLAEAVASHARGELGYVNVALNGAESCGVLLPELMLELCRMRCRCTGGLAPAGGMPRALVLSHSFSANAEHSYRTHGLPTRSGHRGILRAG
jgi:hypothetical protein